MSHQQCCGVASAFNDRVARRMLKRFRRKGPDESTRMLIDDLRHAIAANGATDLTLLDIGAGVGAIHHDLLNGVVNQVVHVDASPSHLLAAREEVSRRGHENVVEFREGDFTAMANELSPADIVTLDRVICCFDDMERLVQLSAGKATRFYGAVYPRQTPFVRLGFWIINAIERLKRSSFRVFLHDVSRIESLLRDAGLRPLSSRTTISWNVVVYERPLLAP